MQITPDSVFTSSVEILDEVAAGRRELLVALAVMAAACGAAYGFTMGFTHPGSPWLQAAASAAKVPILFLLTLAICVPTLHFIGLLMGSRARISQTVTVMLIGIAATCVLLAAFAPISLFFLLTGSEYEFLLLLHVAIFAFCGFAGLLSVYRNFDYLRRRQAESGATIPPHRLLLVWMVLYMFVGSETAFNLAPFVGRDSQFVLLNKPDGNFYTYVWKCFERMTSGEHKSIRR